MGSIYIVLLESQLDIVAYGLHCIGQFCIEGGRRVLNKKINKKVELVVAYVAC